MRRREVLSGALASATLATTASGASPNDFNQYILRAVALIAETRSGGGYDINSAYTRDLPYGDELVRATPRGKTPPTLTMCVAAVAEVMIEAIRAYVADQRALQPDRRDKVVPPFKQLPAATWSNASITSLRPYLWLQPDQRNVFGYGDGDTPKGKNPKTGQTQFALSRGTGHAMSIFRIGEELRFSNLKSGDFVNLNRRNGTGHAVVFLAYIDQNNRHTEAYGPGVIGFSYFSAQGRGKPDAGFAFRDAYFGSAKSPTAGHVADSGIFREPEPLYLNCGRMWHPLRWDVQGALAEIHVRVQKLIGSGTPDRAANIASVLREPAPDSFIDFSGD